MADEEATWQFVDEHLSEDVHQLALKKQKYCGIDFEFALQQIQGRQKTRDKLPALASIPRFVFPSSLALEQCSSEVTAQYKVSIVGSGDAMHCVSAENVSNQDYTDAAHHVCAGTTMADLTGGFGIDTIFLSGLFEKCHYVEPQQQLCEILSHNLRLLQKNNVIVHQDTMEHFLSEMEIVDFLYADPSRRDAQGNRVVILEDCSPNILSIKGLMLEKAEVVMLKLSPMLDIKRALAQLPETSHVYVLAVNGECKELLFLMKKNPTPNVIFQTVNIISHAEEHKNICFEFTSEEELNALPQFSNTVAAFLYEPNAAVLKAGAFKSVATKFELKKLGPQTHLYTSDNFVDAFPGRIFRVRQVLSMKEAKTLSKSITKANVAVRNFPLTAEQLKRNLKLADGGDVYVYGMTLGDGKKVVASCTKEYFKN